jgi:hypothetical protein
LRILELELDANLPARRGFQEVEQVLRVEADHDGIRRVP